jgi:Protein of unknown function (DUF2442)
MISVVKVAPLKNYLLQVGLSDGREGIFSIMPYCTSDYFKEILQDDYFRQVRLFFKGIGWPHGQDIGPDTIANDLVPADTLKGAF